MTEPDYGVPKRALDRALIVDKLDGEPVSCTWRGKNAWVFFLRGGIAIASDSRLWAGVYSAPYVRARISGIGADRTFHLDEGKAVVTFADDSVASATEVRLLERAQKAVAAQEIKVEADRLANEGIEILGEKEPASLASADGLVRRLERLNQLHREGGLTDEEFAEAKAVLLRGA